MLAKQMRNFTALFAQVLVEEDADAVHDLRVCTRRLQQILAAMVADKTVNKARAVRRTLRRVRRALGTWRNCDVALQAVRRNERRTSHPLRKAGWSLVRESIAAERQAAIKDARRRLYKAGGITLNHRVQQMLTAAERPGGVDPAAVVRRSVAQAAQRWRQALDGARADRSAARVHALRIATKRLRYRVELARELGADEAPAMIAWFKSLQDRLGHWHDRQELSRFIARALAASDVMTAQPKVAVEMLKEVEKDLNASAREVDQLFQIACDSEGARKLENWVRSYCAAAGSAAADSPDANHANAGAHPGEQADNAPESDGKVQNNG